MAKTKIVKSRLEEEQYKFILKQLSLKKYSNLDMSKLIRLALRDFFENKRFEATETFSALYQVLLHNTVDMSRVTGNLNQIAYHLNRKDDLDSKEIVSVINELGELHKKNFYNFRGLKDELEKMI